jgi:hypothetical protein
MKKMILALTLAAAANCAFGQTKQDKDPKNVTGNQLPAIPHSPMVAKFNQIFKTNDNGSISPIYITQVGGVTMNPGVAFTPGVSMGGLDIASYKGHDLLVDTAKGVVILKGIYK